MATITQRISHFRGINRSAQQNGLDVSYAYNAENVDIVGGKLTNKIGSYRLVTFDDVPAGRPIMYFTNNGDYMILRKKYISLGTGGVSIEGVTVLGDANLDGVFDRNDYLYVFDAVKNRTVDQMSEQAKKNADVDFDGRVTRWDWRIMKDCLVNGEPLPLPSSGVAEIGPYEPVSPARPLESVVTDWSGGDNLSIRGVGRSFVRASINNVDSIICPGMLGTPPIDPEEDDYWYYRDFLVDGATGKTCVYYLGTDSPTPKIHCRKFGSGLYLLKDRAISSIGSNSDGQITSLTMYAMYSELTDKQKDRALLDGIYLFHDLIGDTMDEDDLDNAFMWLKVTSITASGGGNAVLNVETTRLASEVTTGDNGDYIYIRGECSDIVVSWITMYNGRLFAAAHRSNSTHPRRLYWSCLPGDGRTIEDWTQSEYSIDTSGGHVDIGDPSDGYLAGVAICNNQLLIFTQTRLWRLYGTAPSNWRLELVGNLNSARISNPVEVNGTVYWMSRQGIAYYNGSYIGFIDDDYSTRNIFNEMPKYMQDAMYSSTVHASLFDNSIMFSFDVNSTKDDDHAVILRYELETGNVIRYRVPCPDFRQQFTFVITKNYGVVNGNNVNYESRYFQALVHTDNTMSLTQWHDWGKQSFGWYDDQPVYSVWESDWNDMRTPETVKKVHTALMRGSGEFDLTIESETNKDEIHVVMPETRAKVKELTPHYAEGRSMRFAISSDREFEIEPYMTMIFEAGNKR